MEKEYADLDHPRTTAQRMAAACRSIEKRTGRTKFSEHELLAELRELDAYYKQLDARMKAVEKRKV